ncbi:hypothetical protein OC844_005717 [Tilletia horrida]|nr:hypothetical protein OC844_005717 [Tilletia horrida]
MNASRFTLRYAVEHAQSDSDGNDGDSLIAGDVLGHDGDDEDSRLGQSLSPLSMVVSDNDDVSVTSSITEEAEAEFTPPASELGFIEEAFYRSESVPLPAASPVALPQRASSARPPPEGPVYLTEEFFRPYRAPDTSARALETLFTPTPSPDRDPGPSMRRRGQQIIHSSQDTEPARSQTRIRRVLAVERSDSENDSVPGEDAASSPQAPQHSQQSAERSDTENDNVPSEDASGLQASQHSQQSAEFDGPGNVLYRHDRRGRFFAWHPLTQRWLDETEAFIPHFADGPGARVIRILSDSEDDSDDGFVLERVRRAGTSDSSALSSLSSDEGNSAAEQEHDDRGSSGSDTVTH